MLLHVWGICSLTLRDDESRSILVTPQHFSGAGESSRAQDSGLRRRGQHRSPGSRRLRFPKQRELGPMLSRTPKMLRGSTANRTWIGSRDGAAIGSPEPRANVQRSFRWRHQAIGRQQYARQPSDLIYERARTLVNRLLTRCVTGGRYWI